MLLIVSSKSVFSAGENFDLGVRTINEVVICEENASVSVNIEIYNAGTIEYHANIEGVLYVEVAQEDVFRILQLDQNILPGESYFIFVEDLFVIDKNTNISFLLDVEGDDIFVTELNNAFTQFVNYDPLPNNVDFKYELIDIDCQVGVYLVDFTIKNLTCSTIDSAELFAIRLFKPNPFEDLLNDTLTLSRSLAPNESINFQKSIIFDLQSQSIVFGSLTSALADITYDEHSDGFFPPWRHVIDEFENSCEDPIKFGEDFVVSLNSEAMGNYIYNYNGENYFASSGDEEEKDYKPIANLSEEWIYQVGFQKGIVTSSFRTCVDLSMLNNPILSFDLIQFYNDLNPDIGIPTSAINVSWKGDETGDLSFFGQPEGDVINNELTLPASFVGLLEFKTLNLTGVRHTWSSFLDYDVTLIDNIKVRNKPVSNATIERSEIHIAPNPADRILNLINLPSLVEGLKIFDSRGMKVMDIEQDLSSQLNIENLSPGLYLLSVRLLDGRSNTFSFIKV